MITLLARTSRRLKSEPALSTAIQNLLGLSNLSARLIIVPRPGARDYHWKIYSLANARALGQVRHGEDLASWVDFISKLEKVE